MWKWDAPLKPSLARVGAQLKPSLERAGAPIKPSLVRAGAPLKPSPSDREGFACDAVVARRLEREPRVRTAVDEEWRQAITKHRFR